MSLDFEAPSPKLLKREDNGGFKHIPQLLALGELEFKKVFLLLSYIGRYVLAAKFQSFSNQFDLILWKVIVFGVIQKTSG